MIIGRYLLTALGLDINFSGHVIICGDGPYLGCLIPMDDAIDCEFKPLTDKIIKPEKSFISSYVDE